MLDKSKITERLLVVAEKSANKLLNIILEQGLLVILLIALSGYLAYDKIRHDEKMEDRVIIMEAKIDTLQKLNSTCLFQNRKYIEDAEKCADDVKRLQELLYERVATKRQRKEPVYVVNDTI